MFETLKTLDADAKREFGGPLNDLKNQLQQKFQEKKEALFTQNVQAQQKKHQNFDVTLTKPALRGSLHPYTYITQEISNIFISMGYSIASGPELETEFFNFTALNIPKDHPSREESDTFWINDEHLMRTHTSTVQVKMMQNQKPPIAIIVPERVMRNEATDASHDFMFMQLESEFYL